MSIQNTQDLQQQRHPAMSMIRANPFMSRKIPIEHQQRLHQNQNLQQQYYYGQQSQPQMGVLYNPQAWYQHQEQQYQGMLPGNYQYWYGMPQHVNSPQVFQHNAALPGTITPSFSQQKNGAYGQFVSPGQRQIKPATKTRNRPASKDQAQTLGRPKAGGRTYIPPETSANCSLNRIDSISSFRNDKGSRIRNSDLVMDNYRTQIKMKQKIKKQGKEKEIIKKETDKGKEEGVEPSLGSGASSLFRRLAHYMRFRSARKAKVKINGSSFNDVVSQGSSTCSTPKKRGVFSRLFGDVDSCSQAQSNLESQFHVHYPTNVPTHNIDQDEVREAEGFKKIQAARQSKKRMGNYR